MTRAEMAEALAAAVSTLALADRAAEALRLERERLGALGFVSQSRAADACTVHRTHLRTARESAARLLEMLGGGEE